MMEFLKKFNFFVNVKISFTFIITNSPYKIIQIRLFVVKAAPLLKPLSLKANEFLWVTDDHPDSSFSFSFFVNNFLNN